MPELKSCFHGNRLSSSQRCITSEPCLSLRAVTSALKWRQRWRARQKKRERHNEAAFFHKADLSPFYELAAYSPMWKEATVCHLIGAPLGFWWKSVVEVMKGKGPHWVGGKFSLYTYIFISLCIGRIQLACVTLTQHSGPFALNHPPFLPRIDSVTFSPALN